MTDRELLVDIRIRAARIETSLSMWRWVFGSTVAGGVGWLSFLTVLIIGLLSA